MFNPRFLSADHSVIAVDLDSTRTLVLETGISPDFEAVLNGKYGPVAAYVPAEGDGPDIPDPVVSRLQAKSALLQMGLLDQVEGLMSGMDPMTRLAWSEAVEFCRSSPLLNSLAPYLAWPDGTALDAADLDDLFILAQTIEV